MLNSIFMGNPLFLLTLFGARACNASAPPPLWHPHGVITPKKVIRHNRKAKGRFGGTGTVPSVNRCNTICWKLRFSTKPGFCLSHCRKCHSHRIDFPRNGKIIAPFMNVPAKTGWCFYQRIRDNYWTENSKSFRKKMRSCLFEGLFGVSYFFHLKTGIIGLKRSGSSSRDDIIILLENGIPFSFL